MQRKSPDNEKYTAEPRESREAQAKERAKVDGAAKNVSPKRAADERVVIAGVEQPVESDVFGVHGAPTARDEEDARREHEQFADAARRRMGGGDDLDEDGLTAEQRADRDAHKYERDIQDRALVESADRLPSDVDGVAAPKKSVAAEETDKVSPQTKAEMEVGRNAVRGAHRRESKA